MAACTFDPLRIATGVTLSGGDLVAGFIFNGDWSGAFGSVSRAQNAFGGRYFEVTISATVTYMMIGIGQSSDPVNASYIGTGAYCYYTLGLTYNANLPAAYGSTWGAAGDRIGVLLKNGKIYFRLNGTWQNSADPDAETGEAYSGLIGDFFPLVVFLDTCDATLHASVSGGITGSLPSGVLVWDEDAPQPTPTPILRTSARATNPELFYDATVVIDSLNSTLDSNSITRPSYDQITFTVSQTGATNIEIRRLVNYASYCVMSLEDVLGTAPYIMPTMFTSSATRATNWEMRSDLDIIAQQASWLADQ